MPSDLDQIVARGESEQVEFKESLTEVAKGVQAAAGMLNGPDGGMLLFGVKDNGTIVGVDIGSQTHDQAAQRVPEDRSDIRASDRDAPCVRWEDRACRADSGEHRSLSL